MGASYCRAMTLCIGKRRPVYQASDNHPHPPLRESEIWLETETHTISARSDGGRDSEHRRIVGNPTSWLYLSRSAS